MREKDDYEVTVEISNTVKAGSPEEALQAARKMKADLETDSAFDKYEIGSHRASKVE